MLFFSFFKTLVDHEVTVELKNDISIRGTLKSVDQYLNIKLDDIQVVEELKYPHLREPYEESPWLMILRCL
ncbi:MAG: U6 snRNA-associated Sm-like protein LSm2 [Thelocarpon superellum]|nr:MAG: U6 snRNA-associated Sm-like protein LSm2 [Thelocarpon superellum]